MFKQNLNNRLNKLLSQMAWSPEHLCMRSFCSWFFSLLRLYLIHPCHLSSECISGRSHSDPRDWSSWAAFWAMSVFCPSSLLVAWIFHPNAFKCPDNSLAWEVKSRVWLGKWWMKETRMVAFKGALTILPCMILTILKKWMLGSNKLPFPHFNQW